MTILMNFSNYSPCSHLSPLKPGGHVQPFLSANPPLRHSKVGNTGRFICSVLAKISDILLCLAYACILYSSTITCDSNADEIKRFLVAPYTHPLYLFGLSFIF